VFEAVIFDWDGTLADTRAAIVEASRTALAEAGCSVGDEFIARRIGVGTRGIIRDALEENGIGYDAKLLERLARWKDELQAGLSGSVRLFEGASELLGALRGRVRLALATMSSRSVIERLLPEKGLQGCFDVVVTADDVSRPKPDPEVFLLCQGRLGVEAAGCLVVEDSVFGLRAARAVGMKTIAVPSGTHSREELRGEKPDLLVDSLAEKDRILSFILGGRGSGTAPGN